MKATRHIQVILALTAIIFSCGKPQPQASLLLAQAEQLIEEYPDSALVLIDSIYYPEKSFKKHDLMNYNLLRIQARHKNFLSITEDTIIFDIKNYFTNLRRYPEKSSLASYYCGWLHRERGALNLAMFEYSEAKSYAEKSKNTSLIALIQFNIGALFREQGLFSEALENYKIADQLYSQYPDDNKEEHVYCYSEIGQMYLFMRDTDSAFVYFYKGLDLAKSITNKGLQRLITQNLSVAYSDSKRYEEASKYLYQSMALIENNYELPKYYLNLSELYKEIGKTDSQSFYIDKLSQTVDLSSDLRFKISAYYYLAECAKEDKKYDLAFDYQSRMNDFTIDLNEDRFKQSIFEVKQKYDFIQQQKQYDLLLFQRQRYIIALLVFFLILSIFTVFLLKRNIRQKNKLLSLQNTIQILYKTATDLQQKQISDLQEQSDRFNQEKQLREVLLWKFDILHKSALLKRELDKPEKGNIKQAVSKFESIMYGDDNKGSEWNSLVNTIDELNPGLSQFIRSTYPQFNDTEFKVCILSYASLSPGEIAILINQSPHSVNMTRTRIRQKVNLQGRGADFCDLIRTGYEESQ